MKAFVLAAALLAAPFVMPAVASAATVTYDETLTTNDYATYSGTLTPGSSVTYTFDVGSGLEVTGLSLTGSGKSSGSDLSKVTYTVDGVTYTYQYIYTSGTASAAFSVEDGFTATDAFTVTISLASTAAKAVSYTLSLTTGAAVPLPASAALLGSVLLGAGGIALRRKKKATAA